MRVKLSHGNVVLVMGPEEARDLRTFVRSSQPAPRCLACADFQVRLERFLCEVGVVAIDHDEVPH